MTSHAPYEQATEGYSKVARLFAGAKADKLHGAILSDPGKVVSQITWKNPASAQLIKELTELPTDPAGKQQGEAAFNAVRAAWTQENLIAKGARGLRGEMRKIEASNAGKEFVDTFYGDPSGQVVWKNLSQIGEALEKTLAEREVFKQSTLHNAPTVAQTARDLALAIPLMTGATRIGGQGAAARLVFGPAVKDFILWSSYTPGRTQWMINNILTGPNPGAALTAAARAWQMEQEHPPAASHDQGPPPPSALRR
jgi:hypothetical protein